MASLHVWLPVTSVDNIFVLLLLIIIKEEEEFVYFPRDITLRIWCKRHSLYKYQSNWHPHSHYYLCTQQILSYTHTPLCLLSPSLSFTCTIHHPHMWDKLWIPKYIQAGTHEYTCTLCDPHTTTRQHSNITGHDTNNGGDQVGYCFSKETFQEEEKQGQEEFVYGISILLEGSAVQK